MNRRQTATAAALAAALAWSCADAPTQPEPTAFEGTPSLALGVADGVRISEIHYDNASTDVGEAIEIAGPAGTSLDGWSVVLYNGSNGTVYGTRALSGTLADACTGMGTVVLSYPSNGIQNGNPDGIALVSPTGVVEFLSYGGEFAAVGGVADGMTSSDIGVSESSTTPIPVSAASRRTTSLSSVPSKSTEIGSASLRSI